MSSKVMCKQFLNSLWHYMWLHFLHNLVIFVMNFSGTQCHMHTFVLSHIIIIDMTYYCVICHLH
jgi:hypothetical protein